MTCHFFRKLHNDIISNKNFITDKGFFKVEKAKKIIVNKNKPEQTTKIRNNKIVATEKPEFRRMAGVKIYHYSVTTVTE